ncbi:hypothetical protein WKV47_23990 [Salmonella enterica]
MFFGWGRSHNGSLQYVVLTLSLELQRSLAIALTGVAIPVILEPGPPESGPARATIDMVE